jgi:hypothetical protein
MGATMSRSARRRTRMDNIAATPVQLEGEGGPLLSKIQSTCALVRAFLQTLRRQVRP